MWNERQAKRMLFSTTIGAAITAGCLFMRAALRAALPATSTCGRSIGTPARP